MVAKPSVSGWEQADGNNGHRRFLLLNGYRLLFDDLEAYNWLIGLYQSGRVSKSTIEPWLRQHAAPI